MHLATTATGRPLPPSGKTLAKNRPAPRASRAPRHPAAAKPHVTSQLQCYIPAPASSCRPSFNWPARASRNTTQHHSKFNRQPRRLEITLSHTKQTTPTRLNRQLFHTFPSTNRGTSNRHNSHPAPRLSSLPRRRASRHSPITTHTRSNRHTVRLEIAISPRKQTLGTLSNRHKNTLLVRQFQQSAGVCEGSAGVSARSRAGQMDGRGSSTSWPSDSRSFFSREFLEKGFCRCAAPLTKFSSPLCSR
jgi:hypothetical protein